MPSDQSSRCFRVLDGHTQGNGSWALTRGSPGMEAKQTEISIYLNTTEHALGNMESREDNNKHAFECFYEWSLSISDSYLLSLFP